MAQPRKGQATPFQALGLRLRQARVATGPRRGHNVSQAQMAGLVSEEVGRVIHQTTWSEWELGRSEPPLDVLRAVVTISGVDPIWLAWGEDSAAAQDARIDEAIQRTNAGKQSRRMTLEEYEADQARRGLTVSGEPLKGQRGKKRA